VDDVTALALAARCRRLTHLLAGRAGASDAAQVPLADGVLTHQVLSRLDLDRRTAFVPTQLMGFDYAGAAQVCACPVGTIRSRVARARTQLVAEMGLVGPGRSDPGRVEAGAGDPGGADVGARDPGGARVGGVEAGVDVAMLAEPDEPPVRP
jgi:Sigma-70, region 4